MANRITRRELLVAGGAASVALGLPVSFCSKSGELQEATVVAGGPKDFLTARHLRLEGTDKEIGRQLAEIGKSQHGCALSELDAKLLTNRATWFKANYPQMSERAKGVVEAFDLDWDDLKFDPFGLGYDMMDQPGCSTVFYPPSATESEHPILSRNYDFSTTTYAEMTGRQPKSTDRAFTADPYVLELHPKQKLASLALVSYDLLCGCIDGINEKGLTVALLADDVSAGATPSRGSRPGLGEIEIPRFLLDTCSTVADAIIAVTELTRYYSFIPCHYLVGDALGNSCAIEWTVPQNKLVVTKGTGHPQILTNHLVGDFPDIKDFPEDEWPCGSFNRFCSLSDQIKGAKGKLSLDQIKAFNQSVQAGPDKEPPQATKNPKPGRTLWHSVYELKSKTIEVSFYLGESHDGQHGQRRTEYLKFALK